MARARGFSRPVLAAFQEAKIVGIRAGADPHRFVAVWAVVVEGRVFVRSWNDRPQGWRRALVEHGEGAIQIPSGREVRVRARRTSAERLQKAIDLAYRAKYRTPGSLVYVRGFARGKRRLTTMELIPR